MSQVLPVYHVVNEFEQASPPICFFCSNVDQRYFLAECKTFKALNSRAKRQTVTDARRCLNCLSLDHFVRNCAFPSKCICGPQCRNKHAGALHECYDGVNLAAADRVDQVSRPIPAPRTNCRESLNYTCRKLTSVDNGVVLLRTSAVRVFNHKTGKSTLAYAQHDTVSQVTLISNALETELGLETNSDPNVKIRTLSDETVDCKGRTAFNLESLHTGEKFVIENALVVPQFSDDDSTLPHSVDVTELKHFQGTHVAVAPKRNRIDVLIGQSDKLFFFIEPPTVNEIVELICSLNVNKAVGHDNIPPFFLKTAPFVIANYLCVFVKFSFENGIFPDACKIAKIVAIHKNGNKSNPSNYRPISILTCFSKIFEGMLYK